MVAPLLAQAYLAQQRFAEISADPVPEIIAENRCHRGGEDHQADVESVLRARIDCRADEHRLARHRHAGALQHDDEADRPVAVGLEDAVESRGIEEVHGASGVAGVC